MGESYPLDGSDTCIRGQVPLLVANTDTQAPTGEVAVRGFSDNRAVTHVCFAPVVRGNGETHLVPSGTILLTLTPAYRNRPARTPEQPLGLRQAS